MCCRLKQLRWLLLLLCQHVEPKSLKFFTNALAADLRPNPPTTAFCQPHREKTENLKIE